MSAFKVDGDFTVASATAKPTFSNPFPEVNAQYVLRQPFMQLLANYAAVDLNTAHPDYADFRLVEETDREPIGAGLVTWERVYAKLPTAYSQFETTNYNFIGYYGSVIAINVPNVEGRLRFTKAVNSRIYNEFFRVGPGEAYAEASEIPEVYAQAYWIGSEDVKTDYLGDATVITVASTPTRSEYEALIAAKDEIIAEDSRLTHWMGAYWLRQTRYVKAQ